MTFDYFTISLHIQQRPSEVQNTPTSANTTPTVIMAAVNYQTDINETDDSDMNETLHQLIDFKDLGRNKRAEQNINFARASRFVFCTFIIVVQ